jgi:hypothetical protein
MIHGWLIVLSGVFELCSYIDQLQYNKLKKSIYGLSFDFYILHTLGYIAKLVSCYGYIFNKEVVDQYRLRFPIHPIIPINYWFLVVDLFTTFVSICIIIQLFFKHYHSKNDFQDISWFCGSVCSVLMIIFLYLFKLYYYNQKKILLLDIFDYFWVVDHGLAIIKLVPQIFINFLSRNTRGQSWGFLLFQWLGFSCLFLSHLFSYNWYEIPVNYNGWIYLLGYGVCLIILTTQIHIFYKVKKFNCV